jgi:hypothetical protein
MALHYHPSQWKNSLSKAFGLRKCSDEKDKIFVLLYDKTDH